MNDFKKLTIIITTILFPGIVGGAVGIAKQRKTPEKWLSPISREEQQRLAAEYNQPDAPLPVNREKLLSQKDQDDSNKIHQNINYYINLSSSFLKKATDLANNTENQTTAEKKQILKTLNKSLTAANQAVKNYPDKPEGYLMRATIYQRVAHLYPSAENAAKKDLQRAKALSNGEKVEIDTQHPLESLPAKQAEIASKVTIAEPNTNKKTTQKEQTKTNAREGTGTLPAGKKTVTVQAEIDKNDLLYTTPLSNPENLSIYIKSKTSTSFTVAANQAPKKDLQFKWWVVGE